MQYLNDIREEFNEARNVLDAFMANDENMEMIYTSAQIIASSLKRGGKVISCGNGGSMSDAMHFAEELSGRYREDRKALAAIAISDAGHLSCTANDYGYEYVFSRFIEAHGKDGDVLWAISTSGNSENILQAIRAAKEKGMMVIGLTGKDGGRMADYCDIEMRAPLSKYADRVQEIHIKIIHTTICIIEKMMNLA